MNINFINRIRVLFTNKLLAVIVANLFILCSLVFSATEVLTFKNQSQLYRYNITTANYTSYCTKTKKIFKDNDIYLAINRKSSKEAYYYGCDRTGCRKLTILLTRTSGSELKIDLNILVEGPLAETEGQRAADDLNNLIRKEYDSVL